MKEERLGRNLERLQVDADTAATRYRLISNPNDIVFHKSYVMNIREE